MLIASPPKVSIEEFDHYINLPENFDKLFEYIDGEIIEVPSNPYASYIGGRVFRPVANFVEEHDLGYTTGEAGGYLVAGERYAPDIAFISKIKQPQLAMEGYNPLPPDLAVEVDFPSTYESQRKLLTKIVNYLSVGTMVWLVLPEVKEVRVYITGQPERVLDIHDVLDGGDVLPGFRLAVKDIFPP